MSWIQTFTGKKVDLRNIWADDVCIEDIAHALAHLCRFTGHTRSFYSVAQHSLLASQHIRPDLALLGLLHDAAEAYTQDIPRPYKEHLWFRDPRGDLRMWRDIEQRVEYAIFEKFLAFHPVPSEREAVKQVDMLLLATEARDLMSPLHPDWLYQEANGYRVLSERILPLGPEAAEHLFMERFNELTGRVVHEQCGHEVLQIQELSR